MYRASRNPCSGSWTAVVTCFYGSTAGRKHAEIQASIHGLTEMFEGYAAKPDIIIDDMPVPSWIPLSSTQTNMSSRM